MIQSIQELVRFKFFLKNLVARDLRVRYKGSVLGFFWSLANPLLMMLILSIVFSVAFRISIPKYPVFLLCGLLPWNFFAISLSNATGSVVGHAGLVKKVAFPREILPLSSVMANFVHFFIGFLILLVFLFFFRVKLTPLIIAVPILMTVQFILVLGLSMILSSLNVFYRDVQQILEVLLLMGFYLTPVFYSLDMVPNRFHRLYFINPMASIVTLYRNLLFDGIIPSWKITGIALIISLLALVIGYLVFSHYKFRFAEEL